MGNLKRGVHRGKGTNKLVIGLIILIALIIFLVLLHTMNKPLFSPKSETLSIEEKNKVKEAKNRIGESNGHDYSKLYEVLKEKKGNKEKLFAICDDFGEPIFCLKKVSAENPEFRKEVCDLLIIKIREKYQGKISDEKLSRFVNGHKEDCLLGIPQFAY